MNKYNLLDILSKEIIIEDKTYNFSGIQIPMIQRDYAQGRIGEAEIRKRFLTAIFETLESSSELELDFVYGAQKNVDKKEFFIPLDGQQRLTTLFLLNWYIGNRELSGDSLNNLREILKRFSYTTRATSTTFCEKITSINLSFKNKPSKEISNSSWFFDSFTADPTIKSMLVMLDSIHEKYGPNTKDLFPRLEKITFYIHSLDGFGLTDELYIKMNARGKQLTPFENFKADLIKWMKDEKNVFKDVFQKVIFFNGQNDRPMKYHFSFELKTDTDWTNLFWNYTKNNIKPEDKIIDTSFLCFWNRYLLNTFIVNTTSSITNEAIEINEIFKNLYGNQGDDRNIKYVKFDIYKTILESNPNILSIERLFDNLSENYNEIIESIKPIWNKNENWNLFSNTINQRQRILLFAITCYLERNSFNKEKFSNWIRIVWNIIIDPNIRNIPATVGAMRFINQLSDHSGDIYSLLRSSDYILFQGNSTYSNQIEEEHVKANLINNSIEFENAIYEAESHPLFKGNISFLLTEDQNTTYNDFKLRKEAAFKIFENIDLSDDSKDFLWIRALLAKSNSISLPIVLSNGKFDNWRKMINDDFKDAFRRVIDFIITNNDSVQNSLKNICNNYQIDPSQIWIYPLVNWVGVNGETLLENYSISRKIQKYNNYGQDTEHVYLYNKTQWTESNIVLSNYRNDIIKELIKSPEIVIASEHNVQDCFFKGWNIELFKSINNIQFVYSFDRKYLRVGIKSNELLSSQFENIIFNDDEVTNGWICRKLYNYLNINTHSDITDLIIKIENDVFNINNPGSLIYKIKDFLVL